ncbi:hypothetical protein [Nocardioides sp. SYSU DS0651]|uniref:hypothetical protein n=1 Tax=Nocardioides sp. SYSU DS0651 TaxID=3415955 RepID=UPI003F4C114C
MTNELAVPIWLVVATLVGLAALGLVAILLVASVRRSRRRTEQLLASAAADAEALREQLGAIEEQLRARAEPSGVPARRPVTVVDDREYVITGLAEDGGPAPARVVPVPVFADIVLRESVIRTASLAAGLRRALSPEVRHRVRLEMRREVKRARKQRRHDLRQARREWEARQRAGLEVPS